MKYDYLTPEERVAMIRPRIAGLERDHFAMSLDGTVSPGGNDDPRIAGVEESIETLRKEMEDLESQINSRSSKK